jgi:hypothetical protein
MSIETSTMRALTGSETEAVSGGASSEELAAAALSGAATGAAIGASLGFGFGVLGGAYGAAVGAFAGGFFGGMYYAGTELIDYCY